MKKDGSQGRKDFVSKLAKEGKTSYEIAIAYDNKFATHYAKRLKQKMLGLGMQK